MTKLKEANTYTLEELKWYKFWYDNRAVIKPSLYSKFKEALDEESKTEIEFDLDDLKLIKSGADNYYNHCVRDDYKMSIEEDNILDKLDARISFLRKKNIHQHTKDVFNSPVKSSAEDEETVSNAYVDKQEENWAGNHIYIYTISDIYWINKWCENVLKVTDSISYKCEDAYREIIKLTGKHPEATSNLPIVDVCVFFSLKELKEIRNYASIYYSSSNVKTVEAKDTLYYINLRIEFLEKQRNKILDVLKSGCRESYQTTHKFHTYTKADIFWYAEWTLDRCKTLYPELYKKIIKGLKLTKESDEIYQYYFFKLHELQNIRLYTLSYYHTLDHDQPDRKKSIEESIVLCGLDEKIAFIKEWEDTKLKLYLESEERMKKATESESDCKSENSNTSIMCECKSIATGMCDVELRLSNVIRECIEHGYNVEYKYNDNCKSTGYIQSGEMIHNLKTNTVSFKIEFVSTSDDSEFDIYSKNLDLKAIRFDDKTNTLYLQQNN